MAERMTREEFEAESLGGWQLEGDAAVAEFTCGSFPAAGEFATRVAALCDQQNHHADIDIRYPDVVRVTTTSHDAGGLTSRDVDLARAVSAAFEE